MAKLRPKFSSPPESSRSPSSATAHAMPRCCSSDGPPPTLHAPRSPNPHATPSEIDAPGARSWCRRGTRAARARWSPVAPRLLLLRSLPPPLPFPSGPSRCPQHSPWGTRGRGWEAGGVEREARWSAAPMTSPEGDALHAHVCAAPCGAYAHRRWDSEVRMTARCG